MIALYLNLIFSLASATETCQNSFKAAPSKQASRQALALELRDKTQRMMKKMDIDFQRREDYALADNSSMENPFKSKKFLEEKRFGHIFIT